MKKHEIKAALAKAAEELEAMSGKSKDEGFKKELYEAVKEKIVDLNEQLGRVEEAEAIARRLATPAAGQGPIPRAPGNAKMYGRVKNFKDDEFDGRTVRAKDQAFAAGQWYLATLFAKGSAIDWCKQNGIAVEKAQGEGVDSSGGYLVPEELMQTIIVLREQYGVFRQACQLVPMGRDTLNWPRRVGGVTATFAGENQAFTDTGVTWDNVNLTAKKLTAQVRFSTEVDEDAVISIGDWLTGEIAYAMAAKEDDCGFNGDGTSTYGGMRGTTVLAVDGSHNAGKFTQSSATLTSLTVADFTGAMGLLPQYAEPNARFYMSQQMFFLAVATILAKGSGNTIKSLQDTLEKRLLGYPVTIAQKLPISTAGSGKAQFHFGDLHKSSLMGERRGLTIKRSDHRFIDQDQIGLFATERFDVNNHDLGDNTTVGPLVTAISP